MTSLLTEDTLEVTPPESKHSHVTTYYPWFDWLRLGLATVVLLGHSGILDEIPHAAEFAVSVFFALSGWLIGGVLVKLPKQDLPRFYFNRALRIWCPYFLGLFFLVAVSLLRDHVTPKWLEFVFYKATFVYNIFGPRQLAQHVAEMPLGGTGNHFWSVNAEEQFYLLAPLLLVLLPKKLGRSVLTWAAISAVAWWTGTYAAIALGVLAAVAAHNFPVLLRGGWYRVVAGAVAIGTAVAMGCGASYEFVAPCCAVALVVLLAVRGERHAWGELAGGMSYPLYLNAWLAGFAVNVFYKRSGIHNLAVHTLLIAAAAYVLSAVIYWNFDRRILAVRPRLFTKERARWAMIAAYGSVAVGVCVGVVLWHGATR